MWALKLKDVGTGQAGALEIDFEFGPFACAGDEFGAVVKRDYGVF